MEENNKCGSEEELVSFDVKDSVKEEEIAVPSLEQCLQQELDEQKSNYLRLRADFDNFRKRNSDSSEKAKVDGIALAVTIILPVMDSIDRGLGMCTDDKSKEGLQLIKKQMESALNNLGVTEIKAEGQNFDPNYHNAVQKCEDAENAGKVVEVYQRGYMLKDKVIRYAMVKTAV